MTRLVKLAAELQSFLDSNSWKNCLIGGLVLQRWGEPRLTKDVDMTVLTGFGREEALVDLLLSRYAGRREDTREFALLNRVLLIKSDDGIGIDVALGALEFEERVMQRASDFNFLPDCRLRTCSAEDFVVMKAFANRDQDWVDVESVLIRQGERLKWKQIVDELKPLAELKESPDIVTHLEQVRRKVEKLK
ncbi:MAG: hypothetical protein KIS67_15280 [Verrucomicrobiae bacterium]|nr:hypothetical protein [Verrucomicrobiae bacterium]